MTIAGTAFQKGGGGTNFEQSIQAALVTTMLVKGGFPGLAGNEIQKIVFQSSNYGWETDDMLVETRTENHTHKILIQAKHNLVFSSKDSIFKEVIAAFWMDYNNPNFSKENDRLIIAKNTLNNTEKNHIKTILNYAKSHSSAEDFFSEISLVEEKKRKLAVFRDTITLIALENEITNEELWHFLKCVDLIGYDFGNQTSNDETYILNLIRLTRSRYTDKTETDIWNSIVTFVAKTNPSGGSLTKDNIVTQEFYQNFNVTSLDVAYKSIKKLDNDGEVFLSSISSAIGTNPEFHISRTESIEKFLDLFNEFSFCIVTGRPGVGKSAFVKEMLKVALKDHIKVIFRADQLNRPTLASAMSEIGIQDSLIDIFSCVSLNTNRIIFIDSLEKLLEDSDSANAFKQLFLLAGKNNIKIVATARNYAVHMIFQKFDISYEKGRLFELPVLTETELNQVSSAHKILQQPLQNYNIRQLLQTPKYLDFTLRSLSQTPDDLGSVTIGQFKDKLWRSLICNEVFRYRGLPTKREKAFMHIAVKRATEMSLFSSISGTDEEVLDLLENDDIIFQDGKGRYAPTHDILEDWALVKYVEQQYENLHAKEVFFPQIGNEPAIRRAFRLWIEDIVADDFNKIIPLVNLCIEKVEIENYWRDELLTAVFKSDSGEVFFTAFNDKLLERDARLLNDCLKLIRTSCTERTSVSGHEILLPTGSGWKAALLFLSEHLSEVDGSRLMILKFLYHYDYRLLFQYPRDKQELTAVKEIALFYIAQITALDKFWHYEEDSTANQNLIIYLLFAAVPVAKKDITSIVQAAFTNNKDHEYRLDSFYDNVFEKFLGGVRSQRLAVFLPDLLIQVAWQHWKYIPPLKEEMSDDSRYYHYQSPWPDSPQCWGIEDKSAFFPSGIYKTPLTNLLTYWPEKGVQFAVDFINYSVNFYLQSKCGHKHELCEIELTVNDGSTVKQWGGWEFWVAYRGLSVTHYLLECLLMSLEAFLLDLADQDDEKSRIEFRRHFAYILRNSNSVMPTAVLTSVTMANPKAVGEEMLPLVSFRQMYEWEIRRPLAEYSATAIFDQRIGFAQSERSKSNQLVHRTKYRAGFGGFLIDYQLTIGIINQKIRAIFDQMWKEADSDDILWRKRLHEIDTRKWTASEVDGELGQFMIQPKYESSVESYVAANKDTVKAAEKASDISMHLCQVLADKETLDLPKWEEYFLYFTSLDKSQYQENRPVTFAVITLEKFSNNLDEKMTEWCATVLTDAIWAVIAQHRPDITTEVCFNVLEREITLRSFSTLRNSLKDEEDINVLGFLICYTFISLPNYLLNDFAKEYRNSFAAENPDIAKKVWQILLNLAQFRKTNKPHVFYVQYANQDEHFQKEYEYLINLCTSGSDLSINSTGLSFENSDSNTLLLSALTIQSATNDEDFIIFFHTIIGLIQHNLQMKMDSTRLRKRNRSDIEIDHRILLYVEAYFAEVLLNVDPLVAKNILESLVKTVFKTKKSDLWNHVDVFKFVNSVLCWLVYKIDDISNSDTNAEQKTNCIKRFWLLWNHLFNLISKSKKSYLTSILLLNTEISWEIDRDHSKFLDGRISDYQIFVSNYGDIGIESLIKFLSTVGRREFLLDGLTWITEILRTNPGKVAELDVNDCERIAKYLLVNHMAVIKGNQLMLGKFLFFLDKLIELGSSYAYLVRENVMTYKIYPSHHGNQSLV